MIYFRYYYIISMYEQENRKLELRKYAVKSEYEDLEEDGISLRDYKKESQLMAEIFSNLTEEQLIENSQKINIETVFDIVKDTFSREYQIDLKDLKICSKYTHQFSPYRGMEENGNGAYVYIDEMYQSIVFKYFIIMFRWSKDFDNKDKNNDYFSYTFYLVHDLSILNLMNGWQATKELFMIMEADEQVLGLAESCYWSTIIFVLAHEIAHYYFEKREIHFKNKINEEYKADEIGYKILLRTIEQHDDINNYTYLAPMMLMDFFDTICYTKKVMYDLNTIDPVHPSPPKRKKHLFGVEDKFNYYFDTWEGNQLYGGFLDSFDLFKTNLLLLKNEGKLESEIAEGIERLKEIENKRRKDE